MRPRRSWVREGYEGGEERRSLVTLDKVSPAGPILLRQELFTGYTCTIGVSTVPQTVSKA